MDLIAEVENPNADYGVKEFDYKFVITGINGETRESNGRSFILPSERKHILAVNKQTPPFPIASVSAKINYSNQNWQNLASHEGIPTEVKINLLNYEFIKSQSDDKIKSIKAEIINSGNVEYANVVLKFLAIDSNENIIAVAISEIQQLQPLERQTVNVTLPRLLETAENSEFFGVIFEAESNIIQ